jgi:solute carrier family 25 protein 42
MGGMSESDSAEDSPRIVRSLVAGASAGAVAKSCVAPLDRVKIMFQVNGSDKFSLLEAAKRLDSIHKTEGLVGLWRGNSSMMMRIAPYAAIQFSTFEFLKCSFMRASGKSSEDLNSGFRFAAGAMAGATSVMFTYPLDLMRARFAVHPHYSGLSTAEAFRSMIATEGRFSLIRGLVPTLCGIVPYAGLSFGSYETFKHYMNKRVREQSVDNITDPTDVYNNVSTPVRFAGGALSGAVAQTAAYPFDVVRRRMQVDERYCASKTELRTRYQTMVSTFRHVYKREGVRGLFKGVTMNWIKGPIAFGISFSVYDAIKHRMSI